MAHNLYLTESEVANLLTAARKSRYADYALLTTVYVLALRSTEATLIKREHVNFEREFVRVHVLKRSKDKKDGAGNITQKRKPPPAVDVPADEVLLGILREHLVQCVRSVWLFPHPSDPERPITRGLVKYAYYKAAKEIGLRDGYVWHPHLLRASRATHKARELAKLGVPPLEAVAEVQAALRHATPGMAFEYVKETSETREQARKADSAAIRRLLEKT